MTSTLLDTQPRSLSNQTVSDVLVPKWVESSNDASKAAQGEDTKTVWIIRKASLADSVAHQAAEFHSSKKSGYLILLLNARSAILPPLEKRSKAVACAPSALSKEELDEVLRVSNRGDRFLGGLVDEHYQRPPASSIPRSMTRKGLSPATREGKLLFPKPESVRCFDEQLSRTHS